jgi:signal transduction histidine kinase
MAAESADRDAVRQLAQLRFDLHDGPQQEIIVLAEDMQLLRRQLEATLGEHPSSALLLGHVDDLQTRLVALAEDLRRLSALLGSVVNDERPFRAALGELTDEFAARTGVVPNTTLTGEFAAIGEAREQAVLSLIREALNNVRKHSGARGVWINVAVQKGAIEAAVRDDGEGFDPDQTVALAAADGRVGLVSMQQRMQLLGGFTIIRSRPGGPTVISATLPADPISDPRGGESVHNSLG